MKKFVADTNVFLRFLLRDNEKYYLEAEKYFSQAKKKKLVLILIPQVVFELNYVLRGVYSLSRKESAEILTRLVKSPDLEVKNRQILIETIEKYQKINADLVDLFIYETAKDEGAKVISFDKDFRKI